MKTWILVGGVLALFAIFNGLLIYAVRLTLRNAIDKGDVDE